MKRHLFRHGGDNRAAVAPTVALSLFALIGAAGIAFDYARMASMDSELQNAADQAALAAASQLTSDAGACARAGAAARAMVENMTLLANDNNSSRVVEVPAETACDTAGQVRFYQDVARTPATNEAEAKFVEVEVNPRTAFYALTPVVAAFSSGPIRAVALASLGEAYCKVPPVMICNPQETPTNLDFDFTGLDGVGLHLVSVGGGTGGWAPGNFGYLDIEGYSNGATGLREGLGWGNLPGGCIAATGLDTKPGATVDVVDSLNTRFDIYDNVACQAGGTCPASINSMKDVVRSVNAATSGNGCRVTNSGWGLGATTGNGYYGYNYPTTALTPLPTTITPTSMGHPRDMCHAVPLNAPGACSRLNAAGNLEWDPIGDGNWDRDAYFRTNYVRADGTRWSSSDWQANTGLGPTPRRYDVYLWEIENRGSLIDGVVILDPTPPGASGAAKIARGTPVCSPAQTPSYGSGTVPSETTPDRRKLTVAIVNCDDQGVNGNSTNVQTIGWLDVFLVEPSLARQRSNRGDIYVEIVGATTTGVQLVSKKVPYLIE